MNKQYVNIGRHIVGETIAENVYAGRGVLIVPGGTVVDDNILKRLMRLGIFTIPVYEVPGKTTDKEEFRLIRLRNSYREDINTFKEIVNELVTGKGIDCQKVESLSMSIMGKIKDNYHVLNCINHLRDKDGYTYTHSINVSLYALLIARWLDFDENQIKNIIQAGILHDLGKLKISDEILNKKGSLLPEEYEEIKKHTVIGYNFCKVIPDLDNRVKAAVLMHHEREDGKGYPLAVKGDKISPCAKILAVADVYDALTSERSYKQKMTPFEAFQELITAGYGHFDVKVMFTFLNQISTYYIGAKVKLNTGETGRIVHISRHNISMPIVSVGDLCIDLSRHPDYKIVEMI